MPTSCTPWMSFHGLGLKGSHLNRANSRYSLRSQKYYDSMLLNRLICVRNDDFDDSEFGEPSYIYATRFCRSAGSEDILALANEDGKVIIQNTALSGKKSMITCFEAHNNAIFDVAWIPGSRSQVITVSGDQSAKLWDISNVTTSTEVEEIRSFLGYSRSVKCVEFVPDDPNVFASGSRENAIFVWDIRAPSDSKAVNVIRNAHVVQSCLAALPKPAKRRRESTPSCSSLPTANSSVTAIQFQDTNTLISSSDSDGIIKVWDMRKSYDRYSGQPVPKYQFRYPGKSALKGYSSLILNSAKSHLFACCKDHHIYKFDIAGHSDKPLATYFGLANNSKYFCRISLSHDDRFLVSGSSDNFARVWNVGHYGPVEPVARLEGHEADVTCVEWCSNDFRLVTCGDDMKHRTWRMVANKSKVEKNDISGEAVYDFDIKYVDSPYYKTSLLTSSSVAENDVKRMSIVKRQIFGNAIENNQNVENQLAMVKISTRLPGTDPSSAASSSFPCSPRKMFVSPRLLEQSPRKLVFSPRKLAIFNSPTTHLPNLVLDEISSPGSTSKSAGKKQQQFDWLTTLSRQKKQNQTASDPASGSKRNSESVLSPRNVRAKRKL